jgi:hypothetical protein
MIKRQTKIKVRLNLPDLQIKVQQENQILFLKCHSPRSEHKEIEDKYRSFIKKNNQELEELFGSF